MSNKYSRRNFLALSGVIGISAPVLSKANTRIFPDLPDLEKIKELLKNDTPIMWVFAGDSITQGAKHTNGYRSFPEIFAERVRWEMRRTRDMVINSGISGNRTDHIIKDFEWRVAQFHPQVVPLMVGTNDCAYPAVTVEMFQKNLLELIGKIKSTGAIPILQTPNPLVRVNTPERARIPEFVPVIQQMAKKENLILVDHWVYWQEHFANVPEADKYKKWLEDEAIHPNAEGHSEMARLIFKTIGIFDPNALTCGGK